MLRVAARFFVEADCGGFGCEQFFLSKNSRKISGESISERAALFQRGDLSLLLQSWRITIEIRL